MLNISIKASANAQRPTQNIQSTPTPCRYIDPEPTGWKIGTHERLFDCPILCVKILPIFD